MHLCWDGQLTLIELLPVPAMLPLGRSAALAGRASSRCGPKRRRAGHRTGARSIRRQIDQLQQPANIRDPLASALGGCARFKRFDLGRLAARGRILCVGAEALD